VDLERRARITENIVHLVLAKIPRPDGKLRPGTRGISLFIVAEEARRPGRRARPAERNDVALAGLNHKLGYRGIPNTLAQLRRRQVPGARRERGDRLLGRDSRGQALRCMLPHDERGANRGVASGDDARLTPATKRRSSYARTRPQGGPDRPGGKDCAKPQVRIIEHADVKRMLLAQKSYCEAPSRSSLSLRTLSTSCTPR
jgi:butyryl-CoA dehydrogenase